MYHNRLIFPFESDGKNDTNMNEMYYLFIFLDPKMISELIQTLSNLGAKSCKTERSSRENEQSVVVIAE